MLEVGAFEAKNKLGSLLDLVARGEEVVITRRGKPLARLSAYSSVRQSEKAAQALQRIRERAMKLGLKEFDWEEWKSWRDEGRP